MIFGLFGNSDERKARQINKDAPVIIEQAEQTFTDTRLSEIAATFSEHLDRAHEMFGRASIDLKRAEYEYRKLNKEARRRNEQANMTALTFVVIYLRAELVGLAAAPARAAIDQFVARWSTEAADPS